ncbi:hypothetical protein ABTQ33_03585 [Paucilactobacillus suebicus]|uniref:Uncharacterized protein n=1 Tax=Paucilactobacillus suebicus DSM 5007 = KCTC 3549 TaxID=1423807 RepID=A0A0R1W664_9LACO|nr:hypothetical protein [Paucilactobacillus suebicus]KRM13329.1 hypothetical protein FD16_GL000804 [Paucilactobacillus suebicus DSM 5007 = KCTC 3549]
MSIENESNEFLASKLHHNNFSSSLVAKTAESELLRRAVDGDSQAAKVLMQRKKEVEQQKQISSNKSDKVFISWTMTLKRH